MTARATTASEPRLPLNRERVLAAATALADAEGIEALTMRRLGQSLGVEAMSLYNHVANKEDLLDGVIEVVVGEIVAETGGIAPPSDPDDWKRALRERILSARTVMLRHPWAPAVIETRTEMNPVLVGYYDEIIGIMRAGGISYDLAHHSMHALGSRALGFSQELFVPDPDAQDTGPSITEMAQVFPNLAGMLAEIVHDPEEDSLGWCDDQTEFIFGLDLLLDGIDRKR